MANKPTSRDGFTGVMDTSLTPAEHFVNYRRNMFKGGTRSKWERIGSPLFTPSFEMAMYFTPMNPVVYRALRAIKLGMDTSEGVYAPNN